MDPGGRDVATVVRLPGRNLLLVAGLPGSGKSTLLSTLDDGTDGHDGGGASVRVYDSAPVRASLARRLPAATPYPAYRWMVHLVHRCALVAGSFGRAEIVVVHLPATRSRVRVTVRALARLSRRRAHVLWLDVSPETALDGQRARRRSVRRRPFAGHVAHAAAACDALRGGREAGWSSVRVIDRATASRGLRVSTCRRRRA